MTELIVNKTAANQSRRKFLAASASVAGAALAGPFTSAIPASLRALEPPVARILGSYGTPRNIISDGAVTRIDMTVNRFDNYRASFKRFTSLSDRVHVAIDTVTFERNDTTYIITNRLA